MSATSEKRSAYNKGYLAGKKSNGNGSAVPAPDKAVPKPVEVVIQRDNLLITVKETPA